MKYKAFKNKNIHKSQLYYKIDTPPFKQFQIIFISEFKLEIF